VTVSGSQHNEARSKIVSNHVRVEVFPTVRLVPGDILIYPGGRWTINVEGGPEALSRGSVKRSFRVEDENIATIDEYGEVLGKHVGDTQLTLSMTFIKGSQEFPLATRGINVRVRLITGLEIPNSQDRNVVETSLTRLSTRLLHNNEIFLHAIGPVSYSWKSKNSKYEL